MKRHRVKITGIGPVTPAGIGREPFWKGILEAVSRVRRVDRFPEGAGAFVAAAVEGFDLARYLPGVSIKRMPRHTQFALAAAVLALADAGLTPEDVRGVRAVVAVGASLMDFGAINKTMEMIAKKGLSFGLPSSVYSASISAIGGAICELLGDGARSMAFQSACCSGADAIGHAAGMIARGEVQLAICGGTDAPLYFHPMLELRQAGLAPGNPENVEHQCRPFDLWRTTGVIGEGACLFVLEPESSPRKALAWIKGYAYATDNAAASESGLIQASTIAIASSGLHKRDIDHISAWGPGHRVIDALEANGLRCLFGDALEGISTVSIKGAIGNPLGAAGAIQLAAAVQTLSSGTVPPTVNWQFPDPACRLSLANRVRHVPCSTALVNTHGLSGSNACLIVARE